MAAVEIVLPTACSGHLPAYTEKPRETERQSSGRGEREQHALPLLWSKYKWSPGNLRRQKASLNIDAAPFCHHRFTGLKFFFFALTGATLADARLPLPVFFRPL